MIKGIGIDILRVERVKDVFERHGKRFLQRVFSEEEIRYITRSPAKFFERMTSTFSAKEAVFKTLSMKRPIIFKEIEILRKPYPTVKLHGFTKQHAEKNEINQVLLSITHDGNLCITIAIAI